VESHALDGRGFPIWVNSVGIPNICSLGNIGNHNEIPEVKTNIHVGHIEVNKDAIPFFDFYIRKPIPLRDGVVLSNITPEP
jgi:hypothetical protein